jgi:protein PsiE
MAREFSETHLKFRAAADVFGDVLVEGFHILALFAIGATIVWSAIVAFIGMVDQSHASIKDILLLFIYLELGAMVGIYFRTKHLPVRYLIYIAITALTRLMIDFVSGEHTQEIDILYIASGILILSFAALVLRFGSYKFPSITLEEALDDPEET